MSELLLGLDDADRSSTTDEECAGKDEHVDLRTYQTKECAAKDSCNNLWQTDGAVEEAKIGAHLRIALKCVGEEDEREGKHCCPTATNEEIRNKEYVLVCYPHHADEAETTQNETQCIAELVGMQSS